MSGHRGMDAYPEWIDMAPLACWKVGTLAKPPRCSPQRRKRPLSHGYTEHHAAEVRPQLHCGGELRGPVVASVAAAVQDIGVERSCV